MKIYQLILNFSKQPKYFYVHDYKFIDKEKAFRTRAELIADYRSDSDNATRTRKFHGDVTIDVISFEVNKENQE